MATHSSILAWRRGAWRVQPIGSQRVITAKVTEHACTSFEPLGVGETGGLHPLHTHTQRACPIQAWGGIGKDSMCVCVCVCVCVRERERDRETERQRDRDRDTMMQSRVTTPFSAWGSRGLASDSTWPLPPG